MHIIVAGGSGFLGRALIATLTHAGHRLSILTRRPRSGSGAEEIAWTPDGSAGAWAGALDGADVVVNLAGESIGDRRWNEGRKQSIRTSRILSTRSLVAAIGHAASKPGVFISGSAVGYYGAHGDEIVTESTPPGGDFLASLCVEWEREAERASSLTRSVVVRTGLVLDRSGGVLKQMLLPFRLGLGGRLGSGEQYMPWVHLDDWVGMVALLIESSNASGAFNLTAPTPVTNTEFTRALGRALGRPTLLPVPAFALRAAVGELADSILTGQRAIPARAEELGYTFAFRTLGPALQELLR